MAKRAAPTGVGRNLLAGQVNQSFTPRTRTLAKDTAKAKKPVPLSKPTNAAPVRRAAPVPLPTVINTAPAQPRTVAKPKPVPQLGLSGKKF